MPSRDIDIAILGGGLAGGLLALTLARLRPELRLAVVEQGQRFGGNHVWSFFASDIAEQDRWLVEPMLAGAWDGYDVRFPGYRRSLDTPYRSMTSGRLDAALRAALPAASLITGASVVHATPASVTLDDGRVLAAGGVIDARGNGGMAGLAGGWQKFVGRRLALAQPHGLTRPIVMDAQVTQFDGYRFVYCLPFGPQEIFVEDTYYSSDAVLDPAVLGARIDAYCAAAGWQIAEVLGEERGVLPVIAAGDFATFWPADDPLARAGTRAGLLQPLTSYSLPDAVRFARFVAGLDDLSGAALARATRAQALAQWRRQGFYRMLTQMLFGAAEADRRYHVLELFYRKPQALIERFYAGNSSMTDRLRILSGRPPVRLGKAVASLLGKGYPLASLEKI